MDVLKVINNNIVSALDDNNEEIIVMGRGLGYRVKLGQAISEEKIEKTFRLNNSSETDKFQKLLKAMPVKHLEISMEIIDYTKSIISQKLNPNIYITLTDHINFAISRKKAGMLLSNPLLLEIKVFYPSEYMIGEYAVRLIKEKLKIEFGPDEAASIALHIVNAEYDTNINNTMKITSTIRETLGIVEEHLGKKLDEDSLHYSRLVTHLKFFVHRVFSDKALDDGQEELAQMVKRIYPAEYNCGKRIVDYISEKYQEHKISQDEITYLAMHIRRVNAEMHDDHEEENREEGEVCLDS